MLTPQEAHQLIVALSNASDLRLNGTTMIQVEKVVRLLAPYVAGCDVKYKHTGDRYELTLTAN